MVVFYTFSSDKTVNNREKMPLLCGFLHFAHGYYGKRRGGDRPGRSFRFRQIHDASLRDDA